MDIIITHNLKSSKAPVYHRYPRQSGPQPAFIELDLQDVDAVKLSADWNGEIGNAVPSCYFHDLVVRWGISSGSRGSSILALFEAQEFIDICHRIVDGYTTIWDGNNHVGRYNDDATAAIAEAEAMIDDNITSIEVWTVNDWLFSESRLADHWNEDRSLKEAVDELKAVADALEGEMVYGEIEEALIQEALELFRACMWECLTANQVGELLSQGKITKEDAKYWREDPPEKSGVLVRNC